MRLIDEQWLRTPFFGSRRMAKHLCGEGYNASRKRVRRLMRKMGIQAIYPKPRTTRPKKENPVYPYLLRGLSINRPNQVWYSDITYIPMQQGLHVPGGGDGLAFQKGIGLEAVKHPGS